ncbi:MAG: hypothetical protein ABJL54_11690 [Halioglobus sp.]
MEFRSPLCALFMGAVCIAASVSPVSAEPPKPQSPYHAETWVTGAHFMGANGMYFGPEGKLHLASVVTSALFIVDHESGSILGMYGADKGVINPDDLAFNNEGLLCWTGIVPGKVGCITPEGEHYYVAELGANTSGPNPITFSDDGRLFVGECFFGSEIYEVDPTGKHVNTPRLITEKRKLGSTDPSVIERCGFNGMDLGPDGRLYGPRWFEHEVSVMDVESGSFDTWVDGFGAPAAVKFDNENRLHVIDSMTGEVFRIGSDKRKTLLATLPPGLDNLAFNREGRLFVSSYANGFIAEVLLDNSANHDNIRWVTPPGLSMAGSATVSRWQGEDVLVISDYYSLKYYSLATGELVHSATGIVNFVGGLGTVLSSSPAGEGKFLLTSWIDQQVKVWDENAEELVVDLRGMGAPIDGVIFNGEIVYSEAASRSVLSIPAQQVDKLSPVTKYKADGGSANGAIPAGLDVSEDQSLYMSEYGKQGRLLQLAEKGRWLASPRVINSELSQAEGLHVRDGFAYIAETSSAQKGATVSRVSLTSGKKTALASGLSAGIPAPPGFPPTMIFTGITVADDGTIYVPSDMNKTIYRLTPR